MSKTGDSLAERRERTQKAAEREFARLTGDPGDCRSALVLVEPIFGPGSVAWHGMAFAGGKIVNDITGSDRAVVLDDCLCALAAADIEFEVESR